VVIEVFEMRCKCPEANEEKVCLHKLDTKMIILSGLIRTEFVETLPRRCNILLWNILIHPTHKNFRAKIADLAFEPIVCFFSFLFFQQFKVWL